MNNYKLLIVLTKTTDRQYVKNQIVILFKTLSISLNRLTID